MPEENKVMAVVVEYLHIVPAHGTFCTTDGAFAQLLQLDAEISIDGGKLRHRGDFECDYAAVLGDVAGKAERYVHLKLSIDSEDDQQLARFSEALKACRSAMFRLHRDPPGSVENPAGSGPG